MPDEKNMIDLNIDLHPPMERERYLQYWEKLYQIEIKLSEKIGECQHNLGDTFYYKNPYKRPESVCFALLHVFDLYTWRVIFGFPSWNDKAPETFRIHCPDHTGTIWEMKRVKL